MDRTPHREKFGGCVLTEAERELRAYSDELLDSPIRGPRLALPALKQTLKYAPSIRAAERIGFLDLLRDCSSTCLRDQCWPTDYYKLRLYREDRRRLAPSFFHERAVLRLLEELNTSEGCAVLDDKLKFAAACAAHGLPHVETLVHFEDGRSALQDADLPKKLPRQSLFVKYSLSRCGSGVDRWAYDPQHGTYRHGDQELAPDALIDAVREMSAGHANVASDGGAKKTHPAGTYIIQEELRNHPLIERFSNGALCTIRVLTGRGNEGAPKVIVAALRMPTGSSAVDNFQAGGLASGIELETGRLGRALYKDLRQLERDEHPDSGEQITGETLPFWTETLELCLEAHRCFPDVASVGWDVAITSDGLKLLEANPTWGVDVVQVPAGQPLGRTALPAMLLSHIAVLQQERRASR